MSATLDHKLIMLSVVLLIAFYPKAAWRSDGERRREYAVPWCPTPLEIFLRKLKEGPSSATTNHNGECLLFAAIWYVATAISATSQADEASSGICIRGVQQI